MQKNQMRNPYQIVTGSHRVSYVTLKEPKEYEGDGKPKYSVTLLIPKDHADVAKIKAVMKALYDANKESIFKGLPSTSSKLWNPLRDGDEYADEKEAKGESGPGVEAYRGCFYLKVTSKATYQPKAFYSDKQDIIDMDDLYSGCYCRADVTGNCFDNKSKGYGFYLNSVMKMDDGEPLGGFTASADAYDDEEDLM